MINKKKEESKKRGIEENIKINKEKGNENENKNAIKNNKIETTFEWDEGGNKVLVTGSFCDWKYTICRIIETSIF